MLEQNSMLTRSRLKDRGWTSALINRFMPEPDDTRKNPYYRSAPPVRLYSLDRVKTIEESHEFKSLLPEVTRKKTAASRAVATKRARMQEHLARVKFQITVHPKDVLISKACDNYNVKRAQREWDTDYGPATPASDESFLLRISVNYVRHCLSRYEKELRRVAGRVGVGDAYEEISRKVFDAIAEAYPFLAGECERQFESKFGGER